MSIKIISRKLFLDIKNKIEQEYSTDKEIENIINTQFGIKNINNNNSWRKIYKSSIFKEELNKKDKNQNELKSLLNKISDKNYDEIKKKIIIISETNNLINYCIEYIFEIAVKQPVYCNQYVRLIKEFIKIDPTVITFIKDKCVNYKNVTNTNNVKKNKDLSYDDFCENNKLKNFKEGYSQFIGELFKNNIINKEIVIENLENMFKILKIILDKKSSDEFIEDLIICLTKLLLTINNNLDDTYNKKIILEIENILSNDKIIKRLKFKLMDLKDILVCKINE